jgi:beta-lactamase regulating signal transducer with metallopeptidase domain
MLDAINGAVLFVSQTTELSIVAKATLILAASLAITRAATRARASARHVIIAAAFAALLTLPLVLAAAPAIRIEVAAPPTVATIAAPAPAAAAAPSSAAATVEAAPQPVSVLVRALPLSLAQWTRAVWLAGALVFLLPVATALWRLSVIRRTGIPVAWHRAELARLADARGVALPVELLEHEAVPGPVTFGLSRPVIVLPPDAREWSEAELRRALTHELEHIQRGDWLMQIVARSVAALYWFHPLVWSAWRRLCLEAERSCDDAVVIGEEKTDYAEQLVTLAQRMAATPVQPMLGMANRSDLSARVTAVLDDRLQRGRTGLTFAAGTIAAAALMVIAVAPVRAVARPAADAVMAQAPDQAQLEEELKARLIQRRAEIETLQRALAEMRLKAQARSDQSTADELTVKLIERSKEMKELEQKIVAARRSVKPAGARVRALDRALYEAANEGNLDEVKELVQAGANPSARVDGDGSPLIGAARSGRADITRYLLDQGADPNGTVAGDGSPLITAAQRGRLDQVQLLVERGADVNLAVEGDENPLMNAAEGGHLAIVQYLVSKGADVHARILTNRYDGASQWRTAISQARKNGHTAVVKYLESLGARD